MTRSEAEALAVAWEQRANRRGGPRSGQADLLSGAAEVRVPSRPVRPPCCLPEGARAAGKRLTSGRAPARPRGHLSLTRGWRAGRLWAAFRPGSWCSWALKVAQLLKILCGTGSLQPCPRTQFSNSWLIPS